MKKALMTQVKNSIFEVMETMFFLNLEEGDPVPEDLDPACRGCAIPFKGVISGKIHVAVPPGVLEAMAANFLGLSGESLSEEQITGTLTEALNIIAGNALTHFNPDHYMGLGLPAMEPLPRVDEMDETVTFITEKGPMSAHLSIETESPACGTH
ncbi:MAG: chemotaxis protein CheX [Desulfobacterales bacterium]|nr:chemotaxis protein CheX [Desulfobacterales bacterium]